MKYNVSRLTFGALMAALSLLLLGAGALLPFGRLALCALAGLPVAVAVVRHGLPVGWLTWAASGGLALALLPTKGLALLYLVVFGLYMPVKCLIERLGRLPWEWACKLAYGGGVSALFVWALPALLAESVALPEVGPFLLAVALLALFALYDLALTRLLAALAQRLTRKF
ncbi:MAG: hypothetical protein LBT60_04905 [Oscillospiraceae bacterium]|jgi:hypothetical protein|nr:hypothetical protein [Oscillospiraceae bacterium]